MKSAHPVLLSLTSIAIAGTAAQAQTMPDFSLPDVNSTSRRRAATTVELSPRDYYHQITAWYFAHET